MKPVKTKIHWITICTYPANGRVEDHSHEFFHGIYVMKGSGDAQIDGRPRRLLPGHFYLFAPGKRHAFRNDQPEKLIAFEIKFEFYDVQFSGEMARLPDCLEVSDTPILPILCNIRREFLAGKAYHPEIIALNIQEIFLHLQRSATVLGQSAQAPVEDSLVDVIEYMEKNLDSNIRLQDLADVACLEKTYFLKKFKQLTGTTPMEYVRNLKIKKAMELLIFSDMNITQVSEALGFQSVHYFSRNFSKLTGKSPSQFKKEHPLE